MVRFLILAALTVSGCSQAGSPSTDDPADPTETVDSRFSADGGNNANVFEYDIRAAEDGMPPLPFHQLREQGNLIFRDGCVIMESLTGTYALVFERGSARVLDNETLEVDGKRIPVGSVVIIGGPDGGAATGFERGAITRRCGVDRVWTVAPRSLAIADR